MKEEKQEKKRKQRRMKRSKRKKRERKRRRRSAEGEETKPRALTLTSGNSQPESIASARGRSSHNQWGRLWHSP